MAGRMVSRLARYMLTGQNERVDIEFLFDLRGPRLRLVVRSIRPDEHHIHRAAVVDAGDHFHRVPALFEELLLRSAFVRAV